MVAKCIQRGCEMVPRCIWVCREHAEAHLGEYEMITSCAEE